MYYLTRSDYLFLIFISPYIAGALAIILTFFYFNYIKPIIKRIRNARKIK